MDSARVTATCYALLFTLALYLQRGLGRSAFFPGLTRTREPCPADGGEA